MPFGVELLQLRDGSGRGRLRWQASPVPFGVELLQLNSQGGVGFKRASRVTSAFRRGASSAGLDWRFITGTVDTKSPVPFGVELLQLNSGIGRTEVWGYKVTSAFRRGASSAGCLDGGESHCG